jgi:hypothetical protein
LQIIPVGAAEIFVIWGDHVIVMPGRTKVRESSPTAQASTAYNPLHDEELSLFPDAHETLDRLKEVGPQCSAH